MSDINTPQVIKFCNDEVRPAASAGAQLYHASKRILEEFAARGLSASIPNTADLVDDGATTDGRPVLTGQLVNALMAGLQEYVTTLEANDDQLLNIILQIAPNPA